MIFLKQIKKEVYKANFFKAIPFFALILYNNETFPSINYRGPLNTTILLFVVIATYFTFSIFIRKLKIGRNSTFILLILLSLIFTTMILNSDVRGGYIKIILCLIIGYMLLHLIPFKDFINSYINIMLILAAYSLVIMYLIRPVTFNMTDIIFPKFYNSEGLQIIDARLGFVVNIENYYRNFGIFREAGVYQIFLNFALMFELFYKKNKPSLIKVVIFYIAVASTFSTPGYITGAILILTYIFLEEKTNTFIKIDTNRKHLALFFVLILTTTIIIYSTNNIFNNMFTETVDKLLQKESSYQGRTVAILANLSTWVEKPIFGFGITSGLMEETLSRMQMSYNYTTVHNTSTIGALLATFGILFTGIYIYFFYKLTGQSKQRELVKILIFLGMMITINTQLLIYNELLYTILFYGIAKE